MPEPEEHPGEAIVLAAETLGRNILEALLEEVKQHVSWETMQAVQQQVVIDHRGNILGSTGPKIYTITPNVINT